MAIGLGTILILVPVPDEAQVHEATSNLKHVGMYVHA
jgi:hypothetical protein